MRPVRRFKRIVRILGLGVFSIVATGLDAHAVSPEEMRAEQDQVQVRVVQNRYFIKQFRPEIAVFVGRYLNESYTRTESFGAKLSFFFSESFGLELQQLQTQIYETEDLRVLRQTPYREIDSDRIVHPNPILNNIHQATDLSLVTIPFYGKLNLFDWSIVYSDLHLVTGITQILTDQGPLYGGVISAGQRFFIGKSAAFHFDFRNHIFTQTSVDGVNQVLRNALSIHLGASLFLF